jgi:8-oxo-dGTP diphosphatase
MQLFQVFNTSPAAPGNHRRLNYCPHCGERFAPQALARFERQQCQRCAFIHYLNPTPGITILIRSAEGRVLIGKRRETTRYGNTWCLPGGYIEYEESFIATAHREVLEETGLEVRINGIVNVVSNQLDGIHHTLVIVLMGDALGRHHQPGDDLTELKWIDRTVHQGIQYAFEADKRIIDCYFAGTLQMLPIDARVDRR